MSEVNLDLLPSKVSKEEMEEELRILDEKIRADDDAAQEETSPEDPILDISFHLTQDAEAANYFPQTDFSHGLDSKNSAILHTLCCTFTNRHPSMPAADVRITIQVPPLMQVSRQYHVIPSVQRDMSTDMVVGLYATQLVPVMRTVRVLGSFQCEGTKCFDSANDLPTSFFGRFGPVVEADEDVFELSVRLQPPTSFGTIYDDLNPEFVLNKAVGFYYPSGANVQISQKSEDHITFHSKHMEAIWLPLEDLKSRVVELGNADLENVEGKHTILPQIQIRPVGPLPSRQYQALMDHHLVMRETVRNLTTQLGTHSQSFRAVQQRLLTAFAAKNAEPLEEGLKQEFENAYQQIMTTSRELLHQKELLEAARWRLSAGTSLVLGLMRLLISAERMAEVEAAMPVVVQEEVDGVGWEETTRAALGCILRGKNGKDHTSNINLSMQPDPQQSSKIIKLVTTMVDKWSKLK
ncbi:Protein PTHB1 [Rhizophlyctis rosea]|nr:Protein PTHB1 [Rhizophlyctis rosea]